MQKYIDIVNREIVPVWQPIAQDAGVQINDLLVVPEGFQLQSRQRQTSRQPRLSEAERIRERLRETGLSDAEIDRRVREAQ